MTKKILIIEDNDLLGEILQRKLVGENYEVLWSRDGARGYEMLIDIKPDLLLLDIALPSMNGYEILAEKSKIAEIAKIPVIVVSNSGQPIEYDNLTKYGVRDYVVKANFEPSEVVDKVKSIFAPASETTNTSSINGMSSSSSATTSTVANTNSGGGILVGKKILWVEDDKFLSDIASKKLILEKADLRHSIDSDSAFAVLSEWIPDVIILDVMLPGMSGIDILAKIRTDRRLDKIPVIMLTNAGQDQNVDAAMKLGAKKFLTKATLTPQGIIREIASVL